MGPNRPGAKTSCLGINSQTPSPAPASRHIRAPRLRFGPFSGCQPWKAAPCPVRSLSEVALLSVPARAGCCRWYRGTESFPGPGWPSHITHTHTRLFFSFSFAGIAVWVPVVVLCEAWVLIVSWHSFLFLSLSSKYAVSYKGGVLRQGYVALYLYGFGHRA